MNDYLNINRTLQDRNEDPVYNTMLPGLLVTPKGNGRDNTVYDNRQMIPDGAELDDATRHEIEGQRGAHAVRSATNKAAPYVASLLMGTQSFPYMLSLPGALSTLGGIAGGTIGNQAGRLVDKGLNNKTNWGEGIGSVAGGFIGGGLTVPAYNFAKYPLYREGLYDWIKYRKQPDVWHTINNKLGLTDRPTAKNPQFDSKTIPYKNKGHRLISIKGKSMDMNQIVLDHDEFPEWINVASSTKLTGTQILRPHLSPISKQAFGYILEQAPSGTYIQDIRSSNIPFGAKLISDYKTNKIDFIKDLYSYKNKPVFTHEEPYNSNTSYNLGLQIAKSRPKIYELRYTNEYLPRFNEGDFSLSQHAIEIDNAIKQNKNKALQLINNDIRQVNPNAKQAQIIDGKLAIPVYTLLKR